MPFPSPPNFARARFCLAHALCYDSTTRSCTLCGCCTLLVARRSSSNGRAPVCYMTIAEQRSGKRLMAGPKGLARIVFIGAQLDLRLATLHGALFRRAPAVSVAYPEELSQVWISESKRYVADVKTLRRAAQ